MRYRQRQANRAVIPVFLLGSCPSAVLRHHVPDGRLYTHGEDVNLVAPVAAGAGP